MPEEMLWIILLYRKINFTYLNKYYRNITIRTKISIIYCYYRIQDVEKCTLSIGNEAFLVYKNIQIFV